MDKTTKHVRDIAAMWNSKALKSASLRALALAWTLPRKVVCVLRRAGGPAGDGVIAEAAGDTARRAARDPRNLLQGRGAARVTSHSARHRCVTQNSREKSTERRGLPGLPLRLRRCDRLGGSKSLRRFLARARIPI